MIEMPSPPNGFSIRETPWWMKAVYFFGVPSAIAAFLIWFVTNTLVTSINTIQKQQVDLAEAIRLHGVDTSYYLKENAEIKVLLRQICANTSETTSDRNGCFGR